MPGNSKTLWHAVKMAKNLGAPNDPKNMIMNAVKVAGHEISECLAGFFDKKVNDIVISTSVNPGFTMAIKESLLKA